MTKRSGPKNLLPIPAELVAQWGEDFPIQDAVRTKRWRWVCRSMRGGKPCGHTWEASITSRMYGGHGCRLCAYAARRSPLPDHLRVEWREPWSIDLAKRGYKNLYRWACQSGHLWLASLASRQTGRGCPTCGRTRAADKRKIVEILDCVRLDWSEDFPIEQALRRTRYRFTHRAVCQKGKSPCGKSWETTLNSRLGNHKTGCPFHHSGRPPTSDERRQQIASMILAGQPDSAIAKELRVAPVTIGNLRRAGKLPERLNKRVGLRTSAACL